MGRFTEKLKRNSDQHAAVGDFAYSDKEQTAARATLQLGCSCNEESIAEPQYSGPICTYCDREATEFTWNGRYWCDEHYPLRRPTRPGLTVDVWRARGGDDAD